MEILDKIGEIIDRKTLQVFTVILVFGILFVGIYADGYKETKDRANVLCLSCLGLDPKTTLEFKFDTSNGKDHPDFVTNPLKEKPVFLDYSTDGCSACDAMRPKIKELKDQFGDDIEFIDEINLDHTSQVKKDSFKIYDYDYKGSVPLFVVVTLGYDNGIVKPYYANGYGYLNKDNTEEAKDVLADLFREALDIYDQNKGKQ